MSPSFRDYRGRTIANSNHHWLFLCTEFNF